MKINFNLVSNQRDTSPIRVVINHRGKTYRKSTGLSVPSASWSAVKQNTTNRPSAEALRLIKVGLNYALNEDSTEQDILRALGRVYNGKWYEVSTYDIKGSPEVCFADYFKEWSEREGSGARKQKMMTVRKVFDIMGYCDWEDINEAWYTRFVQKCDNLGMSRNYTGILIGRVKTVLHEGYKLGYHSSNYWREMHRFKEPKVSTYLTAEEAELLMDYKTDNASDRRIVDIFTVGYKTGARFSDYSRLSMDNIKGDRIVFVQQKTAREVVLPCSPRVREVMERNGGRVPQLTMQKFNDGIKRVARLVGIISPVEYVVSKGATKVRKTAPKCELLTSHTARRSCITNLYLSGVSAKECMAISGHTTLQSFETYLKMTNEQTINKLAKNKFFL